MKNRIYSSSTRCQLPSFDRKKIFFILTGAFIVLVALYLRMSGLFRGLGELGYIFHPDEPKQVTALLNFLNGDYVHYYGSRFYDGYPYGLNHLDEYLLRPLLFFFGAETPNHYSLYYVGRLLRVIYGLVTMTIAYKLVYALVKNRNAALLTMFLLAIAPLSITVSHFATGDIGVDLFTAICFLFLLFYIDKAQKQTWLFASGVAVGAAFSAKYNGLLVGMVPAMVLFFEFLLDKNIRLFAKRSCVLISGTITGIVLFTPHLLLDFNTTLANIAVNFQFIKNYNVPAEILAKSSVERAILGLTNNSFYIINSLGCIACLSLITGLFIAGKQYLSCLHSPKKPACSQSILLLSIALFPLLSLVIALSGKYVVQPFHFSYLQLPIIIVTGSLLSLLYASRSIVLRGSSLLLVILIIFEFGSISWEENFFWRLEDNLFYEKNLPASIYSPESLKSRQSGSIRSLYLEPSGTSVFKNLKHHAKGPDSHFWNTIQVAPLPQIPNAIGKSWIFLNGPSFPRNERMLFIHGQAHGTTLKKYLVLPTGKNVPELGIRSGSYATEVYINLGGATATIKLEAHQQKIVLLKPKKWKISDGETSNPGVLIIPLELSVPHDDIWVTLLTTQKEKEIFTLFGGGQEASPSVPEKIPEELEEQYFTALSHIRYMEASPSWKVQAGEIIPMWEFVLPAGSYKITGEIEGLVDESLITIEFEDAKGGLYRQQKQTFPIKKGLQRMEYNFTKPFVPYQGRLLISGIKGDCIVHKFNLVPDYHKISVDFDAWRGRGVKPEWVSRFGK